MWQMQSLRHMRGTVSGCMRTCMWPIGRPYQYDVMLSYNDVWHLQKKRNVAKWKSYLRGRVSNRSTVSKRLIRVIYQKICANVTHDNSKTPAQATAAATSAAAQERQHQQQPRYGRGSITKRWVALTARESATAQDNAELNEVRAATANVTHDTHVPIWAQQA